MKRLVLYSLLCIGLFSACSNDIDIPKLHKDMGFPTHVVIFREIGERITLSANTSWIATGIYNKATNSCYQSNPVSSAPFKNLQWYQEIETKELKMVKENDCDVTLINIGMQKGDTLILDCTSDFVSYNIEEIIITSNY